MINYSTKNILQRIVIIMILIAGAFLHVIITIKYRINTVLKDYVRQETHGAWQLDISKTSLSFLKGRVIIKEINLTQSGIAGNKSNYQLRIDDLYLSLTSWKQLLFHQKLYVDSLRLNKPQFTIFRSQVHKSNTASEQIHDIYDLLKHISEKFKVHVLEINNGDIDIKNNEKSNSLFLINNIYFRIENFGQKKNEQIKLRYSDDFILYMPRQRWTFASGQSISFKSLFFSGKDQQLEVDSCSITKVAGDAGEAASLFTDKIIFKASELDSIIDKNELKIHTLYCKSPVLSFTLPRNSAATDSMSRLNESMHQLFGNVKVQLLHIENGQIQLTSSDGSHSYMSRKTNLSINNLTIRNDHFPNIQATSIDLRLDELSFAGRDSLYVLTIKKFGLEGNDLVCRDAFLKPSSGNRSYLSWLTLPKFTIIDVSLQGLLEKRLKARSVLIERPQLRFDAGVAKKKSIEQDIPVDKFYETLNELAKMIDVHWLTVKNGALEYHSQFRRTAELSIKGVDAEINLDDLLGSTSPLTTKQSIRSINISSLSLDNNKTAIQLKHFFINGNRQTGIVRSLSIDLPSGISLVGENINWNNFSWESFVKDKRIDIDSMNIGKLSFTSFSPDYNTSAPQNHMKAHINIKKLNIRESAIDVSKSNQFRFTAKAFNIALTPFSLTDSLLSWAGIDGILKNISLNKHSSQLTIRQIIVSNKNESRAEDLVYSDHSNLIKTPIVKFTLSCNSINKNTGRGVLPFRMEDLDITDGSFIYKPAGKPFSAIGRFNVKAASVSNRDNKAGAILLGNVTLNVDSARINTANCSVLMNKLQLVLLNGSLSGMDKHVPWLTGLLNAQWRDFSLKKPIKNGLLEIAGCSGDVQNFPVRIAANERSFPVENIVDSVHITGGRFFYTNDVLTVGVSNIRGTIKNEGLELIDIEIKPKEPYWVTSPWQKDHLTFNCDRIVFKNINSRALLRDTSFIVQTIYLQNPRLFSYRDKNIAFHHGIEKLMPTRVIAGIKIPVQIDSVRISGAFINVHEVSQITKREGKISLKNIYALFKNLTNRPGDKDSLIVEIAGGVLGYNIRQFRYAESYNDPLSSFRMNYSISPMHLPLLSEVTNPLAAVEVTKGHADTLYARISGNKYAASGDMNFYYHNLRIRLLNKKDTLKKSFFLDFGTLLANNLVIKSNNKKQATIFFVRDQERFVFNYWVKTLFSGLFASTGAKRSNRNKKMYNKMAEQYALPAANEDKIRSPQPH